MPKAIFQLTFATVFVTATAVGAQQSPKATKCGTVGGVVITGRVINTRTGEPVPGSRVHLLSPICNGEADQEGRFRFEGVRPGLQRFDAGKIGFRDFGRLTHTVAQGDSLDVKLLLQPGGPIEDCLENAGCARLFDDPISDLSIDDAFRLARLATGIALARQRAGATEDWFACVKEQNPAILEELKRRHRSIADFSECSSPPLSPAIRDRSTRHAATGRAAFHVIAHDSDDAGAERRRGGVMFSNSRSGGEGWDCEFQRTAKGWRPVVCEWVVQA